MAGYSWREPSAHSWQEPGPYRWREPAAYSATDPGPWPTSEYLLVTELGEFLVDELGNQLAYA